MSIKKLVSLFALASFASLSTVACAVDHGDDQNPAANEGNAAESQDEELKKSIQACTTDSDCVAVPRGGCCNNGYNEAVNKQQIKAYENATKCTANPRPMCPQFLIHDTRVAQCNTGTNKCEMVAIENIKCGGFTRNPHHCPDGYSCDLTGHVPDVPGKCVKAMPPVTDCRTTGCGAGKYCSACWGHFACIPNGALC